ncbi:thioredoxin [Fusarium acutatum]|uniref:Thioredoxin n=1 Tax=Fusarium acutatum TaxID=78861 RepID=A0A8H4JWK1_9HYPO|nr:thioredoxin [Fusarium acutatum]
MVVHEIHSEEEFKEALENHSVVFVDFWATWSGPSRTIGPIIDRFSEETGNEYMFFCSTLAVFEDGVKKHEVVGANPQAIHAILAKFVKKE